MAELALTWRSLSSPFSGAMNRQKTCPNTRANPARNFAFSTPGRARKERKQRTARVQRERGGESQFFRNLAGEWNKKAPYQLTAGQDAIRMHRNGFPHSRSIRAGKAQEAEERRGAGLPRAGGGDKRVFRTRDVGGELGIPRAVWAPGKRACPRNGPRPGREGTKKPRRNRRGFRAINRKGYFSKVTRKMAPSSSGRSTVATPMLTWKVVVLSNFQLPFSSSVAYSTLATV